MLYRVIKVIFSPLIYFLFFIKVCGKENIPKSGPVIVCSNHISDFDPILLGTALSRKLNFMAKAELFKIPGLNLLIHALGAFPVHRGKSDTEAIRTALYILKKGDVMAIFPEGTRAKNNIIPKVKSGVARIAYRSGATILPVSVKTKNSRVRIFKSVKITILEPVPVDSIDFGEATRDDFSRISQELMQKVYNSLKDDSK